MGRACFSRAIIFGVVALVTLLARKLWQLFRDYREHAPGSRLTARTVSIFGALVIAPLLIVYLFSLEFLNRGIDLVRKNLFGMAPVNPVRRFERPFRYGRPRWTRLRRGTGKRLRLQPGKVCPCYTGRAAASVGPWDAERLTVAL